MQPITIAKGKKKRHESLQALPLPEFVRFWGLLNFRMAIQYVVFAPQRRTGPNITAGEPPFLAIFKISNLKHINKNKLSLIG